MSSRLRYKYFISSWESWDSLFQQACNFADQVGRENVLSISHSCNNNEGVITVWYWNEKPSEQMFDLDQVKFGE